MFGLHLARRTDELSSLYCKREAWVLDGVAWHLGWAMLVKGATDGLNEATLNRGLLNIEYLPSASLGCLFQPNTVAGKKCSGVPEQHAHLVEICFLVLESDV